MRSQKSAVAGGSGPESSLRLLGADVPSFYGDGARFLFAQRDANLDFSGGLLARRGGDQRHQVVEPEALVQRERLLRGRVGAARRAGRARGLWDFRVVVLPLGLPLLAGAA